MFMAFMALVIIASAPLLGGRLSSLSRLRIEHSALLVVALVVQILITEVFLTASKLVLVPLHLVSYVLAGYVLWVNRRVPGLLIIGLGALSNSVVIALNRGTLPASARALRAAGFRPDPSDFENSGVIAHPILPWLGDIAATPSWLPFRNVISIGDLTIVLGAAVLMHVATRSVLGRGLARLDRSVRRERSDRAVTAS